jgi:hypothetical protein
VTFWQRTPREVYSVYGEEEYLSENDIHASGQASQPPAEGEGSPLFTGGGSHSRSGRLLGLGLLLGVTVGAFGLVAVNAFRPRGAPTNGVVRGAQASAPGRPPATASARPGPAHRSQAFAVPGSATHAAAPPRVRPSRSRGLDSAKEGPSSGVQAPHPIQRLETEVSSRNVSRIPIDGEFDFER